MLSLYAELLLNIRQLTIIATLPTVPNEKTHYELSPDRKFLLLTHDHEHCTLSLPFPAASDAVLKAPSIEDKELSFRLPIASGNRAKGATESETGRESTSIWPASALTSTTQLACLSCKTILVNGSIFAWKDLPSEHWAEMMDFWHCHKPHNKEDVLGQNGSTRVYSASSGCTLTPGVGFVDDVHLRLARSDCTGLKVRYTFIIGYWIAAKLLHSRCKYGQQEGGMSGLWHNRRYNYPIINPTKHSVLFDYPLHFMLYGC